MDVGATGVQRCAGLGDRTGEALRPERLDVLKTHGWVHGLTSVDCPQVLTAGDGDGASARSARREPAYAAAWREYQRRCVLTTRLGSPGCLSVSEQDLQRQEESGPSAAGVLTGNSYFEPRGELAGWRAARVVDARMPPALLLRGSKEELPRAATDELAALLTPTGCRVQEYPGAGTFVHIDAWEECLGDVDQFICEVEGTTPARENL